VVKFGGEGRVDAAVPKSAVDVEVVVGAPVSARSEDALVGGMEGAGGGGNAKAVEGGVEHLPVDVDGGHAGHVGS